jgi:uncharacterized membrane protein YfcA
LLLDAPTLAAVAALGLGAAIVGGIAGFGTGVILSAALTPLLGIKAVVPVLAVAGVIINAGRFWFYRRSVDRRAVAIALVAALPFLVIGTWIYSQLDARTVGTVLGRAVIATGPARRYLERHKIVLNTAGLMAGEGLFGLASGVATGVGMIQISVLLGAGLSGPAVLATDALATIALDLCKTALFHKLDLLSEEALFAGIVIGVASIPGSAAAAWLVSRIGAHLHVLFMEALIVFGGAFMLWYSWR